MEQKNIIGLRIRIARLAEIPVCTQKDLSARLDILGVHLSDKALSKIELGRQEVTDYQVVALAKALKVNILWLLGENQDL